MFRLHEVALRYGPGPEVLHGVDLSLNAGEFVFIVGPSGAGKTSLLRLLGLLHPPSAGRFTLFERDVTTIDRSELPVLRRRIGMVFQDLGLLDHLSAFDNVALPLRIAGGKPEQVGRAVLEILSGLGLAQVLEARPSRLSMGQRQLVAVARALVTKPQLLLCDEPLSELDGQRAQRLMRVFSRLCKLGTAVVLATHNHDLADRHPHPILHLRNGRLTRAVPAAMAAAE